MKSFTIVVVMLSTFLSLLGCGSATDQLPVFPATDNTAVSIKKLPIPAQQEVVSFIVSKDKQAIYVLTYDTEYHFLVFGQDGRLLQQKLAGITTEKGVHDYEFCYGNQGLLLQNGSMIYMIDTQNFTYKFWKFFMLMNYPKKSNPNESYQNIEQQYKQFVQQLLPTDGQALYGIQLEGYHYVLLNHEGEYAFYDLMNMPYSGKINWMEWRKNATPVSLNKEGQTAQDGAVSLTCWNKKHTSSVADDFSVGKTSSDDYAVKVQNGTKAANFLVKNVALHFAPDGFFSLANDNLVVGYRQAIYLIQYVK
ncbi:MAG: hypothetical protein U0Y10_08725 [Spirosomataceae bacterium]